MNIKIFNFNPCVLFLTAIADDTFYYSTCLSFLAIAYTRYRASVYRGQASVLVTNRFALKTLLVCFTPIATFAPAILSLMTNPREADDNISVNSTKAAEVLLLSGESRLAYELCHVAVFVLIPISSSAFLYYKICTIVIQAARTMEGAVTSRKNDPSKMITVSVTILLSTMLSVWGIYTVVRIISLFERVDNLFFLYWKLVVLTVHPFGEGVLQKSGKKSTSKVDVLQDERPTRYPIESVAVSSRVFDVSSDNESVAEKLPALIEECETQSKSLSTNQNEAESRSEIQSSHKNARIRRASVVHPRTSVLIRNAAVIGLEYQGPRNNVEINKQRNTSDESLSLERLSIDRAALSRRITRRLSNCLRFSTADESYDDEIYHMYKELYDRRGSKFSEKSRSSISSKSAVPEYKALSYVNVHGNKDRKSSEASFGNESPSQRRWRRLYTTAKTARRFSNIGQKGSPSVIEEEACEAKTSTETEIRKKRTDGIHDKAFEAGPSASSLRFTTHHSLDNHISQNLRSKTNFVGGKKRSISCVSNIWMKNHKHSTDRKKSVSFISSVVLDAPSTSATSPGPPRSFSYDSDVYLSYRKQKENERIKKRRSHGNERARNNSKRSTELGHWFLDKNITREECIAKLIEMKEYF